MRCPDCPADDPRLWFSGSWSFDCHFSKVHGPNRSSKRRSEEECAAVKQQCAGEANRLMALQMEIDELQVAFSDAFGSTIRQLDSQLHDRYGLTQAARAFVRDKFINSVFGVQRRYVQALVLADPQLSSNELGTKLEQLNGLPLDKRISTASSLGSAHVPPVERILGHKPVTLPGGRQVNVPCTAIEFPVTTLMQRFHEWDSSAWDETVQSLQRVYKAFVDRHEQKSFDITDILEGPVVGNEAVTLAFVEAAAKRGGVCDALGNCLLKEEDPCVKYIMHYFDGCGTTDAIGSSAGSDSFVLAYAADLTLHPRRRFAHHVLMLQAIAKHEDVARFGLAAFIGSGLTDEERKADKSSLVYSMKELEHGQTWKVQVSQKGSECAGFRNQLFVGVNTVNLADTPAANEGSGTKIGLGTKTKRVCRHCYASQLDPPAADDYRRPGSFACRCCEKFRCVCSDRAGPDDGETSPFTLRTKPRWTAERAHYDSLPTSAGSAFLQDIGVNTFDHPYRDVPYNSMYSPGYRFLQPRMHVVDEGVSKAFGGATIWFIITSGCATLEECRSATENANWPKYAANYERPIRLNDGLKESTMISVKGVNGDSKDVRAPSAAAQLTGKAAQMKTWTFHSIAIYEPMVRAKFALPGGRFPEPTWWKAWRQYVTIVCLLAVRKTSDEWARQLTEAHMEFMKTVGEIEEYTHLLNAKKPHFLAHFPKQGIDFCPPDTLTEYRLEGEHQWHKAQARLSNRKGTAATVAHAWADARAAALFEGKLRRCSLETLGAPLYSETVDVRASQHPLPIQHQVAQMTGHCLGSTTMHMDWYVAIRFKGKPVYLGGWLVVNYCPPSQLSSATMISLHERLAIVDTIISSAGQLCLFLNVFEETALVKIESGQMVSQHPEVLKQLSPATATLQVRFPLTPCYIEALDLQPVMKQYMQDPSIEPDVVFLVPE